MCRSRRLRQLHQQHHRGRESADGKRIVLAKRFMMFALYWRRRCAGAWPHADDVWLSVSRYG
ncbi:hypothetical protein KCP74_10085 [Salmonella enterica subsp. enterica]|nr:hypothetical protein KCP74_10085 [Salmonella enterica subsp. enterica]